jgi:predicted nucleotidyltransferase
MVSRERAIEIVREFHEQLRDLYGDRLKAVFLFGSYARDEAGEDSDIDVAVVLVGPVKRRDERKRVIGLVSDFCLRENCLLLPFFLSEDDLHQQPHAIHRSIAREGVLV